MKKWNKIWAKALLILAFTTFLALESCDRQSYKEGRFLYEKYCQNCHQADGAALGLLIPPLAGSDFLVKYPDELPCIIYYGLQGQIEVNGTQYHQQMPANTNLNDIDIANLINFINHNFGNDNGYTPLKTVQQRLNRCKIGESGAVEWE